MPASKPKRRGLSWELQEPDGSVLLRGGEGYQTASASCLEITTSNGGKLRVALREELPGIVSIHAMNDRAYKGMVQVNARDGVFLLDLRGDNKVVAETRPKARGKRR